MIQGWFFGHFDVMYQAPGEAPGNYRYMVKGTTSLFLLAATAGGP